MSDNCMAIGNDPSSASNCMVPPDTEPSAPEFAAVATKEPLASAVDFAEWKSLEPRHLSPKSNLENRQSSVSVVLENRQSSVSTIGRIWCGFVLISVVTRSGSTLTLLDVISAVVL